MYSQFLRLFLKPTSLKEITIRKLSVFTLCRIALTPARKPDRIWLTVDGDFGVISLKPGLLSGKFQTIGDFTVSRDCPRFCRLMKTQICTERERRRWISLITNLLNCWAPVLLSQINMASLENLGRLLVIIRYIGKIWDG